MMNGPKTILPQKKGFTLIELLVVIAIIGLLSSIVLASLNSARLKARNTQRISNLIQIRTALELYYNDHGNYPATGTLVNPAWRSECAAWGGFTSDQVVKDINTGETLVPKYLPQLPSDPSMDKVNSYACYLYRSDGGAEYKVLDHNIAPVEPNINYQSYPSFIDPTRDGGGDSCKVDGAGIWAWALYSNNQPCVPGVSGAGWY